ncbi:MAG TPA: hypothetical protein VFL93_01815 [Longimicrobiaceae bacterium]|nr:hypothetical protein [Longimicrobiaceae bacterium]
MRSFLAILLLIVVAPLAACNDSVFLQPPALLADTLVLAVPAPDDTLPSAIDVSSMALGSGFGRFPERAADAQEWDLTVRKQGDSLVFVPAGTLGILAPTGAVSRAGITQAMNRSFGQVIEAPGNSSFDDSTAVAIEQGAVYVARSRSSLNVYGGSCENYAKLQPLAVDPTLGRVTLYVVTNTNCGDPRLVEKD